MSFPQSDPRRADATCWTLVRSAAAGDDDARLQFSRTYEKVARDFLRSRWRGRRLLADVEDAAQEVFLEFLKPGGALGRAEEGEGSFRALLFAVCRNVARRFEEQAIHHRRLLPADTAWARELAADEPGQRTLFDRAWAEVVLQEARDLHRSRCEREGDAGRLRFRILDRRFGDGDPIRDLAREWGLAAQDLHNAYRKARREFYACLREVVAYHAPNATDLDRECERLLELLGSE